MRAADMPENNFIVSAQVAENAYRCGCTFEFVSRPDVGPMKAEVLERGRTHGLLSGEAYRVSVRGVDSVVGEPLLLHYAFGFRVGFKQG